MLVRHNLTSGAAVDWLVGKGSGGAVSSGTQVGVAGTVSGKFTAGAAANG